MHQKKKASTKHVYESILPTGPEFQAPPSVPLPAAPSPSVPLFPTPPPTPSTPGNVKLHYIKAFKFFKVNILYILAV